MRITKIEWMSKDALEARLNLYDGLFNIFAFAQPFKGKEGELSYQSMVVLNPIEIKKIEKQSYSFSNQNDFWSYQIEGRLINKAKGIVKVGNFELELDVNTIPNDISEDEFLTFYCERLDFY